jgi:hypothetical protein
MPLNLPAAIDPAFVRQSRIYTIEVIDDMNFCKDAIDLDACHDRHMTMLEYVTEDDAAQIADQFERRQGQIKYGINPLICYRFADVEHAHHWYVHTRLLLPVKPVAEFPAWRERNRHKVKALAKMCDAEKYKVEGKSPAEWILEEYNRLVGSVACPSQA